MFNKFSEYFQKIDRKYWRRVERDDNLGFKLRFKVLDVIRIYNKTLSPPSTLIYSNMDFKAYDDKFYSNLYGLTLHRTDEGNKSSKIEQLMII